MDPKTYALARAKQARKAWREFLEFTSHKSMSDDQLRRTKRLVEYMVKRMGFNTVIAEQMPNWIIRHMYEFAWREVSLARRKAGLR